ncbi:MAG: hypothetical protein KDK36_05750 [Leptospiraceae bacterium]|nr:hypothetical protein [Leptospiraceae bacterium]
MMTKINFKFSISLLILFTTFFNCNNNQRQICKTELEQSDDAYLCGVYLNSKISGSNFEYTDNLLISCILYKEEEKDCNKKLDFP